MIAFMLLAPMIFFCGLMSMFAGFAATISAALTMVMGFVTAAVTVGSASLLAILIFFS